MQSTVQLRCPYCGKSARRKVNEDVTITLESISSQRVFDIEGQTYTCVREGADVLESLRGHTFYIEAKEELNENVTPQG